MIPAMAESSSVALGKALMAFRLARGLSRPSLAKLVGAHPNQIQKLELGERTLSLEWMEKIGPHLGKTPDDFLRARQGTFTPETKKPLEPETIPAVGTAYDMTQWPRDLPVMGTAECGPNGLQTFNGEVSHMAPRPPSLAGVPKAYAVYSRGLSMVPRYYDGELLHIHPGKPVQPGDFVVIQLRPDGPGDAPKALIKRLVRRSGSKVTVEQFQPAKTFDLKASEIISIHRIVGTGEG